MGRCVAEVMGFEAIVSAIPEPTERHTYGMYGVIQFRATIFLGLLLLSPALTDVRDLGPLVSVWVWPAHSAVTKRRTRWAAAGSGRINRRWNPAYGSILLLQPALISFASYTSWFFHSP
jgi:hypothetical protein